MAFDQTVPSTELPGLTWKQQFQQAIRDPIELCERLELPASSHAPAVSASSDFPVFAPQNYVQRMKLADPTDPLLRQVLPLRDELSQVAGFDVDPVGDAKSKQQPGLIQKYENRVLLITTGLCAIHCR